MRVLLIAPTNFQAYANAVLVELLTNPQIHIVGVLVYKFNLNRFKLEFKRDGIRLFSKIINKAILRENKSLKYNFDTPKNYLNKLGMKSNLKLICDSNNILYKKVGSFNDSKLLFKLKNLKIDIGAFCGGGLLRNDFLNCFSFGVINCHMGILPKYRGMDVVEWPFLLGDKKNVGITCHIMDSGVDTGDILEIVHVDYSKFKNFIELREYLTSIMFKLMINSINSITNGKFIKKRQLLSDGNQFFVMHPKLKEIAIKSFLR